MASTSDDTNTSSPAPNVPSTTWERIRAANAKQAQPSSWDSLRQNHERTRISESKRQRSSTGEEGNRFYDDTDRAAEQAKFDELLEKERNFK